MVIEIDGESRNLTAKGEYNGNEIHLLDEKEDVYHLVIFHENPADKRYDFAVSEKGNSANQMIASTFMRRDGDVDLHEESTAVENGSNPNSAGESQNSDNQSGEGSDAGQTDGGAFQDISILAPREGSDSDFIQKYMDIPA